MTGKRASALLFQSPRVAERAQWSRLRKRPHVEALTEAPSLPGALSSRHGGDCVWAPKCRQWCAGVQTPAPRGSSDANSKREMRGSPRADPTRRENRASGEIQKADSAEGADEHPAIIWWQWKTVAKVGHPEFADAIWASGAFILAPV